MKINRECERLIFEAEDHEELMISYSNRGNPFVEGVSISIRDGTQWLECLLTGSDARELRDKINEMVLDT